MFLKLHSDLFYIAQILTSWPDNIYHVSSAFRLLKFVYWHLPFCLLCLDRYMPLTMFFAVVFLFLFVCSFLGREQM